MATYLLLKYNEKIRRFEQLGEAAHDRKELRARAVGQGEGEFYLATVHDTKVVVRPPARESSLVVDFRNPNPRRRKAPEVED